MDSLEWSKKFEVFSISRLFLCDQIGFTTEQVESLLEEDMFYIADVVCDNILNFYKIDFNEEVRYVTETVLATMPGGQDDS